MAKIYRKRGNKLNEVVTFDSACTRQENQPLVYDATDGSVHTTTHIGCLNADDVSVGNLTVTGQAIIQEQVTDTIGSNTLVLRSNADAGLTGTENSGVIIHNYNGSEDLYAVTDNTGTFRVGTAVSTTTTYAYLRYNETDNKWYSTAPGVTPAVKVTPVGSPTSWDSVVTSGDDVEYTNIVFSVIDRTSLEPLTTRDESTDMEADYLTKWNATDEKIITTGTSCTHDLCANGDITSTGDITANGNVCVKTNITVDGNSCLKGNSTIDGNSCVKGTSCTHDLCANGDITSTGDITADGNVCVKTNITIDGNSCLKGNSTIDGNSCLKGNSTIDGNSCVKGTSTVTGEIHSCDCITTPTACISDDLYVAGDINNCNTNSAIHGYNGCFENNFCIKGDLSVDGFATISGLMSDYVATTEDTTTNDWEYLTFVPTNHLTKGRNSVYTDGDLKYNPYSNTLYMGNACVTDTACITCACVGDGCVNNLCVGTVVTNANATKSAIYCVTNVTGNNDFAIPLYNKNITNVNSTKKAELSYVYQSGGPKYNPNTNTFCVCCVRTAKDVIADEAVAAHCVVSSLVADLAAGATKNIVLDARCKNSSGTLSNYRTTFCGTDGKIYNDYGICSTGQLNGLNTPVTSDFYSGDTSTGYMYLGYVEGESKINHDVSVSGMIYTYDISNSHASIKEKTNFTAILRGTAGTNTIYEAYTDNYSTRLKFTREVKGNKFILRLYYQLASAYNRIIVRIDEVGIGDMGPQVPPASYWKPSGTIVTSMTGTQFYWNLFPNSGTAKANMAYCLCDVGTTNGYADLSYGSLRGVSSICGNISFCDPNGSENYCTIYSFATLAHRCQGLGAYNMGSWLYHQESSSPVGIFNPNMDPNEVNFLPDIKSIKDTVTDNVNHCYRMIGYSLAAYEGNGNFYCGPYFALYRPCSYTNSNWCNCIRAVMNWRNCVCRDCTTQAGTWICNSMIELIDSQGGQTIEHNIRIHDNTDADITLSNANPKIIFSNSECGQNGCLVFTDYDSYLNGASLTFATNQGASWFCSQYVKSDTNVTCSLRLYHCATATNWQSLACVSFGNTASGGSTHCSFLSAACPDANGINIAFGQNAQTIIYAGESAATNFANFITQNGAGEKVVLVSDSSATDIVLNANGGITCVYKWCFEGALLGDYKWNTTSASYSRRVAFRPITEGVLSIDQGPTNNVLCGSRMFVAGKTNIVYANNTVVIGQSNTNGTPSTTPDNVIMIGSENDASYCNRSRSNVAIIGACNFDCSSTSWTTIFGFCNINYGTANISIGYGHKTYNAAIAIGDNISSCKYNTTCDYGIRIGSSTTTSVTCTNAIAIGTDANACGDKSVAIGYQSCACEGYAIAIGCGTRGACGGSAIGTFANAKSSAVALGTQAYAEQRSVAAGHYACAIAQHAIAIGTCAKANIVCSIAIGENANTNVYGAAGTGACILVDERVGGIRRSIICWNVTTKQCDLFNAIYCRFNFNLYANCNTVYVSVTGVYDSDTLNEIKWDKNETNPMNFDLGRQGFTNAITIYENCTCAIPKAGYVQIVGYAR